MLTLEDGDEDHKPNAIGNAAAAIRQFAHEWIGEDEEEEEEEEEDVAPTGKRRVIKSVVKHTKRIHRAPKQRAPDSQPPPPENDPTLVQTFARQSACFGYTGPFIVPADNKSIGGFSGIIITNDVSSYCERAKKPIDSLGSCCNACQRAKKPHNFAFCITSLGNAVNRVGLSKATRTKLEEVCESQQALTLDDFVSIIGQKNLGRFGLKWSLVKKDDEPRIVTEGDADCVATFAGDDDPQLYLLPSGLLISAAPGKPIDTIKTDVHKKTLVQFMCSIISTAVRHRAAGMTTEVVRSIDRLLSLGNVFNPFGTPMTRSITSLFVTAVETLIVHGCEREDVDSITKFAALAALTESVAGFFPSSAAIDHLKHALSRAVFARTVAEMSWFADGSLGVIKKISRGMRDGERMRTAVDNTFAAIAAFPAGRNRPESEDLPVTAETFPVYAAIQTTHIPGMSLVIVPPSTWTLPRTSNTGAAPKKGLAAAFLYPYYAWGRFNPRTNPSSGAALARLPDEIEDGCKFTYECVFRGATPRAECVELGEYVPHGDACRTDVAAILAVGDQYIRHNDCDYKCTVGTGNTPEVVSYARYSAKDEPKLPSDEESDQVRKLLRYTINKDDAPVGNCYKFSTPYMNGSVTWLFDDPDNPDDGTWDIDRGTVEDTRKFLIPIHPAVDVASVTWQNATTCPVGKGMAQNADELLKQVFRGLHPQTRVGVKGAIHGKHTKVYVNHPDSNGKGACNARGGEIWRTLCVLSVLYPGALRVEYPGKFSVPFPPCLRYLEDRLAELISASTQANDEDDRPVVRQTPSAAQKTISHDLDQKQQTIAQRLIETMERTGGAGVQGTTGSGKTRIAALVIKHFALTTDENRRINRAVVITVATAVATTVSQLRLWGIEACSYADINRHDYSVWVVSADTAKNETHAGIIGPFVSGRPCMVISDECDAVLYSAGSNKANATREYMGQARLALMMSATIVADTPGAYEAVGMIVGAPVNRSNVMSAMRQFEWFALQYDIKVVDHLIEVPVTSEFATSINRLGSSEGASVTWQRMAAIAWDHCDPVMVEKAFEITGDKSHVDIAIDHGDPAYKPRVVVVARNNTHAERLLKLFNERKREMATIAGAGSIAPMERIVIIVMRSHGRAVNWLAAFSHVIMSEYPSTDAGRKQFVGRFVRTGQKAAEVHIYTVLMQGILSVMRERHATKTAKSDALVKAMRAECVAYTDDMGDKARQLAVLADREQQQKEQSEPSNEGDEEDGGDGDDMMMDE